MQKSKFPKKAWSIIRYYLEGHIGNISHECGKNYEYLCYLKPISIKEHFTCNNGKTYGHKKCMYPETYPEGKKKENIEYWKELLKEDYEWFVLENLVCD